MNPRVAITLDQLYRPQPGGIATYVRGLVTGLAALDERAPELVGVAPRGRGDDVASLPLDSVVVPMAVELLTRLWSRWPVGVPGDCDVVHASSLAGPLRGGRPEALHSVALHDLLWRDEPGASTARGVRFHEVRLNALRRRDEVRVVTTAPGLAERLVADGFAPGRIRPVHLGIDDAVEPASADDVATLLSRYGVGAHYTLYVGTRQPRKNIDRLVRGHALARSRCDELGPLVLVGPSGWGGDDVGDALVLGAQSRALVKGLYRDATVVAYVPLAEGYGLPPVEALGVGARVVASATTPSVAHNREVITVDPMEVESIRDGLIAAIALGDGDDFRRRRAESVSALTWRQCALDHLAAWT